MTARRSAVDSGCPALPRPSTSCHSHTPGDTYIYLPKEKILIAGDILVNPIPFAVGGSYPQEWIETLQKLEALDVDTIIPGHGDAERDETYLRQNLRLFQHVLADVKEARAKAPRWSRPKLH